MSHWVVFDVAVKRDQQTYQPGEPVDLDTWQDEDGNLPKADEEMLAGLERDGLMHGSDEEGNRLDPEEEEPELSREEQEAVNKALVDERRSGPMGDASAAWQEMHEEHAQAAEEAGAEGAVAAVTADEDARSTELDQGDESGESAEDDEDEPFDGGDSPPSE